MVYIAMVGVLPRAGGNRFEAIDDLRRIHFDLTQWRRIPTSSETRTGLALFFEFFTADRSCGLADYLCLVHKLRHPVTVVWVVGFLVLSQT